MKTRSDKTISLVKQLTMAQEALKRLARHESDLKAEIRAYMGTERVLEAEDTIILIETRNRTDLDKDALFHDLGHDVMRKYQKRTEYECMLVKPMKKVGAV